MFPQSKFIMPVKHVSGSELSITITRPLASSQLAEIIEEASQTTSMRRQALITPLTVPILLNPVTTLCNSQ